ERCHLKGFRYSPLGLRDGLLAQMAAEYDRSTRSGKQIESERSDSIAKAVAHYGVDRKHALDVRASAMRLFTALRSIHRLPAESGSRAQSGPQPCGAGSKNWVAGRRRPADTGSATPRWGGPGAMGNREGLCLLPGDLRP